MKSRKMNDIFDNGFKRKKGMNTVQAFLIQYHFKDFPENRHRSPCYENETAQRRLIKIYEENLRVNPGAYGGRKSAPVDEIKNPGQIQAVARKFYDQSKEKVGKMSREESIILKSVLKSVNNSVTLEREALEERVAIAMEGENINPEKVRPEFIDKVYYELKGTPGIDRYLPLRPYKH